MLKIVLKLKKKNDGWEWQLGNKKGKEGWLWKTSHGKGEERNRIGTRWKEQRRRCSARDYTLKASQFHASNHRGCYPIILNIYFPFTTRALLCYFTTTKYKSTILSCYTNEIYFDLIEQNTYVNVSNFYE